MTKKILLSLVASATLFATVASASSLEDRLNKLEQIIAKQQKTIENLQSINEEVEDIDERLETVETRSFTDKIQFGLGMKVELNNYDNTYANGMSYSANEIWRTKLNLNMKSKIADNLKFSGRLSMYKNWGDSTPRGATYDSLQGRRPDNSQLYVERAYLDWLINNDSYIPVTATIGRQPSSDGPSYQFKENTTRKGTYDALVFDAAVDGIVLTGNMEKAVEGLSLRYIYATPNVQDNQATSPTYSTIYTGAENVGYENVKVHAIFIDQVFNSLPFENLTQAYFVRSTNFYAVPGGITNVPDVNVGDFDMVGGMFEASKINDNIDFFFHYAKSIAKPNGKSFQVSPGNYLGLLSTNAGATGGSTESIKGEAFWTGIRYSINKDWKIGAEYNKGSKNWFSFTLGSSDPLNKLATRGDAIEVYVTKNINKNANFRLGYVDVNYDYSGSGVHLGAPVKISSALGNLYIKETKNTYLTLTVLF